MSKNHSMPNTSEADGPCERLLALGASALSDAEVLAVILGTGSSQGSALQLATRILADFDGLHGLAQASFLETTHAKGVGSEKTAQIAAAVEIGRRLTILSPNHRPIIQHADDVASLVADMHSLRQEQVRILLLDSAQRLVTMQTVYLGTLNASIIRISELFREAIIRNSPAVILVHNHPSGDPAPSPEDIQLTRSIISAGALLDITVLDHIIIGHDKWASLKELGLAFS